MLTCKRKHCDSKLQAALTVESIDRYSLSMALFGLLNIVAETADILITRTQFRGLEPFAVKRIGKDIMANPNFTFPSQEEKQKLENFNKKQAELLSRIPQEFHSYATSTAWEEGHAYGYDEVITHLHDIVYGLESAAKAYKESVINKYNEFLAERLPIELNK